MIVLLCTLVKIEVHPVLKCWAPGGLSFKEKLMIQKEVKILE